MAIDKSTFKSLQAIVGSEHATRQAEDRHCYAYDATRRSFMPDAVVFPESTDQVARIIELANQTPFYVVPRGAGSGMTGGSLAVKGGVVMAMNRFNRIHAIDTDNLIARVEPGVVTGRFQAAVAREGLFYPPDPSSSAFSTLGGNLAECAGGPQAVKYGVTRDYVLGLQAVTGSGAIIRTGVQTAKGVVGYDMARLIIGSEGTLAVITDITLKLLPLPEAIQTLMVLFDRIDTAAETVSELTRRRIIPRKIEFMDNAAIRCAEKVLQAGLPVDAEALLLIEVDGDQNQVAAYAERVEQACRDKGALQVEMATDPQAAADLWRARKAVSPALFQYGPDKINEDIVVPRSKIPAIVRKIEALRRSTGLMMVSFGHAGDGNIHFNIMLDKQNPAELKKAHEAVAQLFDYTLELGGTISGEHGIGITKAPYLAKEIGPFEMQLMRNIKSVFDPKGILNPGKIFPVQSEQPHLAATKKAGPADR